MRGFTLLEVLVSFVILALVLGVVMRIFSDGLHNVEVLSNYEQAVIHAESQLMRVGADVPLKEGEMQGVLPHSFHWKRSIELHDIDEEGGVLAAPLPVRLYDVDVEVWWGEGSSRSVELHTLRLGSLP